MVYKAVSATDEKPLAATPRIGGLSRRFAVSSLWRAASQHRRHAHPRNQNP